LIVSGAADDFVRRSRDLQPQSRFYRKDR